MFGTCFVTITILLCIIGMFYIVKYDKTNYSNAQHKLLYVLLCVNTIGFLYIIYFIWMVYFFPTIEVHQIGFQTLKLFRQ